MRAGGSERRYPSRGSEGIRVDGSEWRDSSGWIQADGSELRDPSGRI